MQQVLEAVVSFLSDEAVGEGGKAGSNYDDDDEIAYFTVR